jgi:hypothetical protein
MPTCGQCSAESSESEATWLVSSRSSAAPFTAPGADPCGRVTVQLTQTAGTLPYYAGSQPVDITASGRGLAELVDVVLHGPDSIAVLVAVLVADGEALRSDEAHVQVIL